MVGIIGREARNTHESTALTRARISRISILINSKRYQHKENVIMCMIYIADAISLLYFGVHPKQNANARLSHDLPRDLYYIFLEKAFELRAMH